MFGVLNTVSLDFQQRYGLKNMMRKGVNGDDAGQMEANDPQETKDSQLGVRTTSVRGLISDAASNTGTHGIPNIMRTKSLFRRIFWSLLVLFFFGKTIRSFKFSRGFLILKAFLLQVSWFGKCLQQLSSF